MSIIQEKMKLYSNMGLTDKSSTHSYDQLYPQLLEKFLGKQNNILEIGTGQGGGLMFLSESFPESTIYGVDHDYSTLKVDVKNTNITLVNQMDQTDYSLAMKLPMLDIVIEDASHDYRKSMKTFENLKNKLNPGAIYIIEDVYPQFTALYQSDKRFRLYDLRENKNRQDDVVAVFIK